MSDGGFKRRWQKTIISNNLMKKIVFIALILISSITMFGASGDPLQEIEIGQQYIIQSVENDNYQYINFPNSNIIIKRGGIADFKKLLKLSK